MNEPMPAAQGRTDVLTAPVMRELKQFSASKQEILTAAGMYLLAYLYLRIGYTWQLPVFTAGFILITELLSRNVTRSKENLFWLFCLILTAAARTMDLCIDMPFSELEKLLGELVAEAKVCYNKDN